MNDTEFKCSSCGEIYEKVWTDEEAMDFLLDNFKVKNDEKLKIVCEFCYDKVYDTLKNKKNVN
jgi:hypothetical protein